MAMCRYYHRTNPHWLPQERTPTTPLSETACDVPRSSSHLNVVAVAAGSAGSHLDCALFLRKNAISCLEGLRFMEVCCLMEVHAGKMRRIAGGVKTHTRGDTG